MIVPDTPHHPGADNPAGNGGSGVGAPAGAPRPGDPGEPVLTDDVPGSGGPAPTTGSEGSVPPRPPRRRRRRVVRVSEVDRHLIERGLPPSWEEKVDEADMAPPQDVDPDRGDGANDRRLMDNVPPHSQPRV